jgi:signal transduction histidine kinase
MNSFGAPFGQPRAKAHVKPLLREWLFVITLMSVVLLALSSTRSLSRLDQALYDITLKLLSPPVSDRVMLITIDEPSLAELGPWPWPASRHAEIIERLVAAKPAAIGYDVLLDQASGLNLSATIRAATRARVPVVMPVAIRAPGFNGRGHDAQLPPAPAIAGHNLVRTDNDGILRRVDLVLDGDARWVHFGAALANAAGLWSSNALPPPAQRAEGQLVAQAERLIGFRGPPGSFSSLPASAILEGEVPRELIEGRIVLVGVTVPALSAKFATATAGQSGGMSGLEVAANIVADRIEGLELTRSEPGASLLLAMSMLWVVMAGMLALRPAFAAVFGVGLMALVLLLAAAALQATGRWADPAAAVVALLAAPPLWAWRRLAVVNDWMTAELNALGDFGLPKRLSFEASDPVTRTTELLAATIDRVEELRRLADAALRDLPDATLLMSETGDVVAANGAAEALFGANPDCQTISRCFAGADLPPFGPEALAARDSPWSGEFRAANGSVREVRYTPWRNAEGKPLGWIVRFADISALRKAEAAREEALQLLTHDMRAPQASILALVDRTEGVAPEIAERLRTLARRTIGLADGYLQLARADAGGYRMEEVDLAAIAVEAIDELWPLGNAHRVLIVGEGVDRERLSWGNQGLLHRALTNLLSNAVKHAPAGSKVVLRLRSEYKDWRIDVTDKGKGVPSEIQAQLFRRFRTSGEGGGVGLGLAFVKAVAEGHGGYVRCTSVPGEGATFSLVLPGLKTAKRS